MATHPQPPFDDYRKPPRDVVEFPRHKPAKRALWKRVLIWTGAGLGILILLLVVTVFVLLHSSKFHNYVKRVAQERATTALGATVHFRDYALHFSGISPTLDLYDVQVDGAPPHISPPLFTMKHMRVGVTVASLLKKSWYLNEITMDQPVVRVYVDKNGENNIPKGKTSNSNSNTSIFDLGIRHAAINQGQAYYNDRKSLLTADLHDLMFSSTYALTSKTYSGKLSYRDGHLKMDGDNPLPHDLDASFTATPQEFTLSSAVLTSGRSRITLNARVTDYQNPKLDGAYDASLDTGEFARILKNPSLPTGTLRATGNAHYASRPNVPMLAAITLNGNLSSNALNVKKPSLTTTIRDVGARYSIDHGNADVRDLHARLLGGQFTGALQMRDLAGNTHSHLNAALNGVQLAELKPVLNANTKGNNSALNSVALRGTMNATADATWGKTMNDLVARADANLNGSAAPAQGGGALPINGGVHARYTAANQQVSLIDTFVRMQQTSLTLNGTVSNSSALQVRLQSNDLHELETAADLFAPKTPPLGLAGQANFNGSVTGTLKAPRLTGQLTATNLKVKGSDWRLMHASLDASPSRVSVQSGELDPADRGRITFALSAGLRNWSFSNTSPIQAQLNAQNVNAEDLTKLAGSQAPVSGTLGANVQVSGSELSPIGHGTVSLTNAKIAAEPVKSVNLNFQGTGDQVHSTVTVQLPQAGSANAVIDYAPKTEAYDARLTANGIKLDQLQTVKDKNLQIAGVLNLNASGRGTVKDPQLTATATIPQLTMQGQTMKGITFQTNVANHVANFNLDSEVLNTSARAHGTVDLTGAYDANVVLDTQVIPLAPLVAIYAPTQAGSLTGQTELHAWLRGPLKDKSRVNAQLTIPQLSLNYQNKVQLAAAGPIRADYANGVLNLQRGAIRGTDTDLQFQGRVPIANPNQPLAVMLLGTVDLQLASLFDPDIASSGQLKFNIDSTGTRANPNANGQIQIVNANFATGDAPLGLQNGNGVLRLTSDRVVIDNFTGNVGGGKFTATGGIAYRPALQFDIGLQGQGMRMLIPGGIRTAMSTNLSLTGNMENALLSGRVNVNQLSFTPEFDLMNFAGQLSGDSTPPPAQGFSTNLKLNIALRSTNDINLVSRTLSVNGAANLRITGTAADPVILGRVNVTGGDLIFQGNRYLLNGGTLDFVNTMQTEPVVNMSVSTTIQQYNIQMRFWGPADKLHTNYASDPALPPADIINLIAFGKTTEAAAANPQPGNMAAESAIASQVTGQVTNRLEKVAGISQLSIDPELGGQGSGQNPGARIAIQQRVTSNIFVTFATDVNSAQDQEIKIEYKVSPRMSVNAVRNQNGGFAMDAQFHKKW